MSVKKGSGYAKMSWSVEDVITTRLSGVHDGHDDSDCDDA